MDAFITSLKDKSTVLKVICVSYENRYRTSRVTRGGGSANPQGLIYLPSLEVLHVFLVPRGKYELMDVILVFVCQ